MEEIVTYHNSTQEVNFTTIADGDNRRLFPCDLKQLELRGITEETAKKAGLYSESNRKKIAHLIGWKNWPAKNGSALVFPYLDADGREVLSRIKPENPPNWGDGKPRKYMQPSGQSVRAYFPPGVHESLNRNSTRILITEGEFKALKATQEGFHTIALPGVNAWAKKNTVSLNNDLSSVDWRGKTAYICFDSDAETNSNVMLEEQKLAAALEREGAIVKSIRLPMGAPDEFGEPTKLGLDDFLVEYGPAELETLIEQAQEVEKPDPGTLKTEANNVDPNSIAELFVNSYSIEGQSRIRFYQSSWWYWERGAYREMSEDDLKAAVVRYMSDNYQKVENKHVSNVTTHLKSQTCIPTHVDSPVWLPKTDGKPPCDPEPDDCISLSNGILQLSKFLEGNSQLIEPTPRYFTFSSVNFKMAGTPPKPVRWHEFLDSVFEGDNQSRELLQQWFGYCLSTDTTQQKALFLVGPKRSGKGTIARVLNELLGKKNIAAPTFSSLATNFGLQALIGKPLAIIHDARLSARVDQSPIVERLLSITGEDHQTIDRKYKASVTVKLPTRFMLMSNELPRLTDSSGALVGRLLLIRMTKSFYGNENLNLTNELLEELSGIFAWAIEGWKKLYEAKRFTQPDSAKELLDDLEDLSSPVAAFIIERCDVGDDSYSITKTDLYQEWSGWCDRNGLPVTSSMTFGKDLLATDSRVKSKRIRNQVGTRVQHYTGICLRPSWSGCLDDY